MTFMLVALVISGGGFYALRGAFAGVGGLHLTGFDRDAMGMGLLAILAAGYFWGPLYGLALILVVALHEFGHVAAFRICGHTDARFRLVPLIGGIAISNRLPSSQDKAFFIALMGPAIWIGPMLLMLGLSDLIYDRAPGVGDFLWVVGQVAGALNFFNLLPLYPLDGARCIRYVFFSFWPNQITNLTYAMSGAMLVVALMMHSILMVVFCLISARQMLQSTDLVRIQHPMSKGRALLCLGAYLATAGAFYLGGESLIAGFF